MEYWIIQQIHIFGPLFVFDIMNIRSLFVLIYHVSQKARIIELLCFNCITRMLVFLNLMTNKNFLFVSDNFGKLKQIFE